MQMIRMASCTAHERLFREDLRKEIVEALGRGATKSEAARTFVGVSRSRRSSATPSLAEQGRPLAPQENRPGSKPKMDERTRRLLEADVERHPAAAALSERREFLQKAAGGVRVSDSTVSRML